MKRKKTWLQVFFAASFFLLIFPSLGLANPIAIRSLNETFTILTLFLLGVEVFALEFLLRDIGPLRKFILSFLLMNFLTFPIAQELYSEGLTYLKMGNAEVFLMIETGVILVETLAGYLLLKLVVECRDEVSFLRVFRAIAMANLLSAALGLGMIFLAEKMGINPYFSL